MYKLLGSSPEHLRPAIEHEGRIELIGTACTDLVVEKTGIDAEYAAYHIGSRLERVNVVFDHSGFFDDDGSDRLAIRAIFHNSKRRIHLNPNLDLEIADLMSDVDHESIHAAFTHSNGKNSAGESFDRNGIQVNTWNGYENVAKGMWLNEAMVETIRLISGLDGTRSDSGYSHAVNLLGSLMDELPELETELYTTLFFTGDSSPVFSILGEFGGLDWCDALDEVFNDYYRNDQDDTQRNASFSRLVNEVVPSNLHAGMRKYHRIMNGPK